MASQAPPLLPAGSRIAGYEIGALVGRGGMGEVYRAKQISMQREVALKILAPRLAKQDPAFADQFVAEARAAGKLNHPNIVGVHDVGQAPAPEGCQGVEPGTPIHYFSMEFIDGETVKDVIERQGAVDVATIGKVMAAMAEALAFAEQHKIVHRDIKPDNIMLTSGGGVKLADLGLALQADSAEAVAGSKDEQGRGKVMGTPLYMAPEQARAQPIDHRADQYALGATLFHMLTGSPPYQGESSKAIMRAHCFEPVPDPAEVNPQVPPPWRDMCMRMLAKLPAERFGGAAELRTACKAAVRWRPGPAPRTRSKRGGTPWVAIALAVAALAAAAWWLLFRPAPTPPARIDEPGVQPAQSAHPTVAPPSPDDARAKAERALATLPEDPYAALPVVERLLADPTLAPAHKQLKERRDSLRATIEERRRNQLTATLDAAFQDAATGRLEAARTGLAGVPDEGWNKARRSEVAARIELSERTVEARMVELVDQIGDARACDIAADEVRKSELSAKRAKNLLDRIDLRRKELAAPKPPPKQQKADTAPVWKQLGEAVEAARGKLPYGNLAEAARSAARNLPDGERQHAEMLAEAAEAAQQAETALRLHIGQANPKVECRMGSRSGTYILTRLEKDSIGLRLADAPVETRAERDSVLLPWSQLLQTALSGAGKERCAAAYLWYWRQPEARAAVEALKDDPVALAIATYERRTRSIDIPGEQERRKDGIIAVSYPFQASRNAALLGAWKGGQPAISEAGLRWESTTVVPRGSTAEADLATMRWNTTMRAPIELEARLQPDADSEVVMLGLAGPQQTIRIAFNPKMRRAFILATREDDKTAYQPHGAKGSPEYGTDGVTVRMTVDANGRLSAWVDDKPVPGDRELGFAADARLTVVVQARPLQARSALTIQSLSVSGRP